MAKRTQEQMEKIMGLVKGIFNSKDAKESKLVSIKDKNEPVDKSKLTSIKDKNEPVDKSKLTSIKDKNEPVDKSKLTSIRSVGEPKLVQYNDGWATIEDGKGNSYDAYLRDVVKGRKFKVKQVNDGMATIEYENGGHDTVNLRNKKR